MKIGILTYHRSHNYGALLQAIGLRHILLQKGHNVYFIDYWPEYHQRVYDNFSWKGLCKLSIKEKLSYIKRWAFLHDAKKERIDRFNAFIDEFITPYCLPYNDVLNYDIVIYGSDQIWRKQLYSKDNYFNDVYFADNLLMTNKHVAYAASMGQVKLSEKDKGYLKSKLIRFDKIAVRETDLLENINLLGFSARQVLDPTLLITSEEWDKIILPERKIKEPYILYYRLQDSFDDNRVKEAARIRGCKLITIVGSVCRKKEGVLPTEAPRDFISLIKYADFVFTSSFHGLAFSLIYKRQFFCSMVTSPSRVKSLLEKVGLSRRFLSPQNASFPIFPTMIDYDSVDEEMEFIKQSSITYLNEL